MKKKLTSEELAEAWKEGFLPLHIAVRRHFKRVGLWPVHKKLMFSLEVTLGFANLGLTDTMIFVDDDKELLVSEIIERYKLEDFLG